MIKSILIIMTVLLLLTIYTYFEQYHWCSLCP